MEMELNFLKETATSELEVLYDHRRCIHAEQCIMKLSAVFRQHKDGIYLGNAPTQSIIEAIDACPSGALRYKIAY